MLTPASWYEWRGASLRAREGAGGKYGARIMTGRCDQPIQTFTKEPLRSWHICGSRFHKQEPIQMVTTVNVNK
jgi:hypothetical protein